MLTGWQALWIQLVEDRLMKMGEEILSKKRLHVEMIHNVQESSYIQTWARAEVLLKKTVL